MRSQKTFCKGQVLSTEVVISLGFFTAAMILFMGIWNIIYWSYNEEISDREMNSALISVSDSLALTGGNPSGWENGDYANAHSIGLASEQNVLSPGKISALERLGLSSYQTLKEKMGAGRFDLYFEVTKNSQILHSFGKKADLANNMVQPVTIQRMCILEGEIVSLKVQLWRIKGKAV